MAGFIYRFGVALKEAGERRGWPALIRLGLRVKDRAMRGRVWKK
jgi:hypothetical protein